MTSDPVRSNHHAADAIILWRITPRRAEVLRELADGFTEREAAAHLGISAKGVRSHAEDLKNLTGCASVRELARWWRANRERWIDLMREISGVL